MEETKEQEQKSMSVRKFIMYKLHEIFDLSEDKENERATIEILREEVDFRGAKMWVLIFAIMIASLGLNLNSTAVVIGAMLISPLMSPIVGFGLGLGILDFELIKRSLRSLGLMTFIGVFTAMIYFYLSPLDKAQSELLARTQPTIYDVLIAFVGGAAGILANSTKNKGNIITGVAIATALMPPLCTAGYGLATWQLNYFAGAFYLYFINSLFIGLATFLMVRIMRFPKKLFVDVDKAKRVGRIVSIIAVCTIVPSVYFGFALIRETVYEEGVKSFVEEHLNTLSNQVVKENLIDTEDGQILEVVLLGQEVPQSYIDSIQSLMPNYGLENVRLVLKQGFNTQVIHERNQELNVTELKNVLLNDLYENSNQMIRQQAIKIDSLQTLLKVKEEPIKKYEEVKLEVGQLFPQIENICFTAIKSGENGSKVKYVYAIVEIKGAKVKARRSRRSQVTELHKDEYNRLKTWLRARLKVDEVRVVYDH